MTVAKRASGSPKSSNLVRNTACSRGQRRISGFTSSGNVLSKLIKTRVARLDQTRHDLELLYNCLLVIKEERDHPVNDPFGDSTYAPLALDAAGLGGPFRLLMQQEK